MATVTLVPIGYDSSRTDYLSMSSSYPPSNSYTSADSDTYAEYSLITGARSVSTFALKFDISKIPSNTTINSLKCTVKAAISSSSSYVLTGIAQLYFGSNAMGNEIELGTSAVAQTFNNVGYWTYEKLQDMYLLITCTRGSLYISRGHTVHIYGATLTIDYDGGSSGSTEQMMVKQNGVWTNVSKVYKKVNGLWVEQTDITNLFSTSTNYVKG